MTLSVHVSKMKVIIDYPNYIVNYMRYARPTLQNICCESRFCTTSNDFRVSPAVVDASSALV